MDKEECLVKFHVLDEETMKKNGFLLRNGVYTRQQTLFVDVWNHAPNYVSSWIDIHINDDMRQMNIPCSIEKVLYSTDYFIRGIYDSRDEDEFEHFLLNGGGDTPYYRKVKNAFDKDLLKLQKVGIVSGFKKGMDIPRSPNFKFY